MKKATRISFIIGIIVVAGIIASLLAVSYSAKQQPHRGIAIEDLMELFQPETKKIGSIVIKTYREFRGNTVRWSATYFGCLFGSAFLSALAALLLKLELLGNRPKIKNDLAAIFATCAALLITLSTTGEFQRKWYANRIAATEMENLAYDLARSSAPSDLDAALTRIQEINETRNRGILGELAAGKLKEPPVTLGPSQSDPTQDTQNRTDVGIQESK